MKVLIELKPEDADGLGGEILTRLGMKKLSSCLFAASVVLGVRHLHTVGQPEVDPGDLADSMAGESRVVYTRAYVESLTDVGIRPVRVRVLSTTETMSPVLGSAIADFLDATKEYVEIHGDAMDTIMEPADTSLLLDDPIPSMTASSQKKVFQAIYRNASGIEEADISKKTGVPLDEVTNIVSSLLKDDLVQRLPSGAIWFEQ